MLNAFAVRHRLLEARLGPDETLYGAYFEGPWREQPRAGTPPSGDAEVKPVERMTPAEVRAELYTALGLISPERPDTGSVLPRREVRAAYHKAALRAHPDHLQDVAPEAREAQLRHMQRLNALRDAYNRAFPGVAIS
jgi:hypothetical protein